MRTWLYGFHHTNDIGNPLTEKIEKQPHINLNIEERMKLISFMAEVETDGLGVSCKFFSITYSTFGSVNNSNV